MRVLFCFVAFALGLHTPLTFGDEKAPATIEVDLRFSSGPNGLPPANDSDGAHTESLNKEGFAVFTQATQLSNSDFYTGYWIAVGKSPDNQFQPFNVQIFYNDFRGLLELEPGKRSPIMTLVQQSTGLFATDKWQEVPLRDPVGGEMLAVVYIRIRSKTDTQQGLLKPVILEALPQAAK